MLTTIATAPPLSLSLFVHVTARAGPRKSPKRWWLHVQILFANFAAAVPFGILLSKLANRIFGGFGLRLGLVDIRFAFGGSILILLLSIASSARLRLLLLLVSTALLQKADLVAAPQDASSEPRVRRLDGGRARTGRRAR